ncbi:hypothetical protein CENSYa_0226 [Cenarchaeum symbiosum A]|uniref:Uncharacterized protein n=1 Tax=Cenarchaeum symbiosum (strain A) TaxID=414004 RepID=A0RU52_CENSY|nr:hypothetical protein CENSYa_0226 [Cenarchaeum symbiosum A]
MENLCLKEEYAGGNKPPLTFRNNAITAATDLRRPYARQIRINAGKLLIHSWNLEREAPLT